MFGMIKLEWIMIRDAIKVKWGKAYVNIIDQMVNKQGTQSDEELNEMKAKEQKCRATREEVRESRHLRERRRLKNIGYEESVIMNKMEDVHQREVRCMDECRRRKEREVNNLREKGWSVERVIALESRVWEERLEEVNCCGKLEHRTEECMMRAAPNILAHMLSLIHI